VIRLYEIWLRIIDVFVCDLRIEYVELTRFDGINPAARVTVEL